MTAKELLARRAEIDAQKTKLEESKPALEVELGPQKSHTVTLRGEDTVEIASDEYTSVTLGPFEIADLKRILFTWFPDA